MDPEPPRNAARPARAAWGVLALVLWAGLLVLAFRLPPDGREHGDLGQFLGRFHPVVVHGPVTMIALVALMEVAGIGWRRADIRAAAGWILALCAVTAFAAAYDGWLLAWSGGYRGHDVNRHMWGGISLAGACAVALWIRHGISGTRRPGILYPAALSVAVGLMVWTGHGGGKLSHGDDFLTAKMPARLRNLLGLPPVPPPPPAEAEVPSPPAKPSGPAAAPAKGGNLSGLATLDPANPGFYRLHVEPLFVRSCVSCHKPQKHKGGLRMDTYAQLMRGGDNGAEIVPGNPKDSELIRRLTLPPTDDDSMPSDGEKALTPEEIQTVSRWIAAGAKSG